MQGFILQSTNVNLGPQNFWRNVLNPVFVSVSKGVLILFHHLQIIYHVYIQNIINNKQYVYEKHVCVYFYFLGSKFYFRWLYNVSGRIVWPVADSLNRVIQWWKKEKKEKNVLESKFYRIFILESLKNKSVQSAVI